MECWLWHGGNATFLASPAIIGRVWGAWGVPDGDTEAQGWGRDAGDTATPCRGAGELGGSLSGRSQSFWEQQGRAGPAPSLLPPPGTRLGTSRPERPRGRRAALEPTLPLAPPRLRTLPRILQPGGGPRGTTATSRAGDGTGDTPGGPQILGGHGGARGRGRGRRSSRFPRLLREPRRALAAPRRPRRWAGAGLTQGPLLPRHSAFAPAFIYYFFLGGERNKEQVSAAAPRRG